MTGKRLFDIVISIIIITFSLPILLICGIVIAITSKGDIIFKQKRIGLNGRFFTIYKLRSMYINSETYQLVAQQNDPRITPIGRLIRKTKIDELPQCINVLKGDMSIVGPRPMRLCIFVAMKNIKKTDILEVKPGLTGYGQLQKLKHDISLDRVCLLDIKYAHTKPNLRKEFLLCVKTIKLIIHKLPAKH